MTGSSPYAIIPTETGWFEVGATVHDIWHPFKAYEDREEAGTVASWLNGGLHPADWQRRAAYDRATEEADLERERQEEEQDQQQRDQAWARAQGAQIMSAVVIKPDDLLDDDNLDIADKLADWILTGVRPSTAAAER